MNRLRMKLAITAAAGSLLFSNSVAAQVGPYSAKALTPAAKASRVRITQGPELESANDNSAIIRWKSNNPGGADEHFGVVHYGTNPKELSETAKSPVRLNQNHSYTVFRVRVDGLKPQTTYCYTGDSLCGDGR